MILWTNVKPAFFSCTELTCQNIHQTLANISIEKNHLNCTFCVAGDKHHFNICNHLLAAQQLQLPTHGWQNLLVYGMYSNKYIPIYIKHTNIFVPMFVKCIKYIYSNLCSKVSVNGVEVRAVKPGVYRHTITGT